MTLDPALTRLITDFFAELRPEARRIFHGRGQCYPGLEHLCIDWYAPLVLITAWQPLADADGLVAHILDSDSHGQVQTIMLQQRHLPGAPAHCLAGSAPDTIIVREGPLQFEVQPGKRQNAGLFLDSPFLPLEFILDQCEKYLPGYTLREQIAPAPAFHEADLRRGLKIRVLEMPANPA